jgi:hypothetical protein
MRFSNERVLAGLFCVLLFSGGCQHYADSTPRQYFEGDNEANYQRVFRSPVPQNVTVIHSIVVGYASRPGVVTTDDFEFELLASEDWIKRTCKKWYLREQTGDFIERELEHRKQHPLRSWYAPRPLDSYDLYRDVTSVGYVHMLVEKSRTSDRFRVFLSKH